MGSTSIAAATAPASGDFEAEKAEQRKKWHQRLSRLFCRDDNNSPSRTQRINGTAISDCAVATDFDASEKPRNGLRFPRQVIPGLPRPGTFRRQLSEHRDRLEPSHADQMERRTLSVDRRSRLHPRHLSPAALFSPRISAPAVYEKTDTVKSDRPDLELEQLPQQPNKEAMLMQRPTKPPTPPPDEPNHTDGDVVRQNSTFDLNLDLEDRWILNLSMHFRDKSLREKFFITYAETPNRWRRVTVSCDYRNAPPESLESDLRCLHYQRDKSARIYEAIHSSLADIQFYDTVTNLRLETSADERLHVHVTEDVNEIIPYPDSKLLNHLDYSRLKRVTESDVHFLSHMSGFVYKVKVDGETLIKKEIPGPDSIEEFLYEINALHALLGSDSIVQIRGIVYDESFEVITGLLIEYYEQGPLVDVLFDYRGQLSWDRKAKWAAQIIQGLGEIHEAGYVQGDFTVSNICIGQDDNARIIDINRRGCPVGWEPPEIARMIESGQRISMYIGVKSDVFQLGMVLWALAMEDDEPERRRRPLQLSEDPSLRIPEWYRDMTSLCMETEPRDRPSASHLLSLARQPSNLSLAQTRRASSTTPSITLAAQDLAANRNSESKLDGIGSSPGVNLISSSGSRRASRSISPTSGYDEIRRGRSPARNTGHLAFDLPRQIPVSHDEADQEDYSLEPEVISIDPTGEEWRQVVLNGHEYLMRVDAPSPPALNGEFAFPDQPEEPFARIDRVATADLVEAPEPPRNEGSSQNLFGLGDGILVPEAPWPPTAPENHSPLDRYSDGFSHAGLPDHRSALRHSWSRGRFDPERHDLDTHTSDSGYFQHQDSGLGDMDLDFAAGSWAHEALQSAAEYRQFSERERVTDRGPDHEPAQAAEEPQEKQQRRKFGHVTHPDSATDLEKAHESGGEEEGFDESGEVSLTGSAVNATKVGTQQPASEAEKVGEDDVREQKLLQRTGDGTDQDRPLPGVS